VTDEQGARLAASEAPDIVHAPVMCRQQPAIGRQIEQRDRARPQAAMRSLRARAGSTAPWQRNVERQVSAERAIAERHFVDRAAATGRPPWRRRG